MWAMDGIGGRLKTLRRARALTQADLSKKTGVAVSTLVSIERGVSEPQVRTLRRLAGALGTTTERLVLGEAGASDGHGRRGVETGRSPESPRPG